jgi:hypothetical protein
MTTTKGTLSRSTSSKGSVIEGNNSNPLGNEIVKTDVIKDVEPITTPPDEEAINKAKALVEKTKASYLHAKQALELLTGKPEKKEKTPGVISTIFDLVKNSGKTGISKADILSELIKLFPDRTSDGMEKTIQVQLPSRMSKERDVKIEKTEDGKYLIK